jgi:hypothetical protein
MNASQLLEVATKVFVNWDQETQKEAEWKMKKKVDLLAIALNGQGGHSYIHGRCWGRGIEKPPTKLPTSMAPGCRAPKEKSMCLLSPRGPLEKWVLTAPGQTQSNKKERGLCGSGKHWAGWGLGLTQLFPPQPPRAHGPFVSRNNL